MRDTLYQARTYFPDGKPTHEMIVKWEALLSRVEALEARANPKYATLDLRFDSAASGTQVAIVTVPAGSMVLFTSIALITAFNAGSSNEILVGTSGDPDALVATVAEGTPGSTLTKPETTTGYFAAETTLYARYTRTGSTPTTGQALITIAYV